nr:HEPN domain-containing protein [Caulobacter sp. RHG1]
MENTKHSGRFRIGDRWIDGDLDCRGPDTTLRLHDETRFEVADGATIEGLLSNRVSVTLIGCLPPSGLSAAGASDRLFYYADIFVHHVVAGPRHFDPAAASVRRLAFITGDTNIIFHDRSAFGTVHGQVRDDLFKRLVAEAGRPVEIGDYAELMYFTGKLEICAVETDIGRLVAEHRPRGRLGSIMGVGISNQVMVTYAPREARCFADALDDFLVFLRFFGQLTGRQQSPTEFLLETSDDDEPWQDWLRVHWSLRPPRPSPQYGPQPGDLPLQAAKDPEVFGEVLASWVAREATWRTPRMRLDRVWSQTRGYDVDRLVSAANMFDILPASAAPRKVALTAELETVQQKILALLKPLPESLEKDSLRSAAGRLGSASLKRKVLHCADRLPQGVLDRLPDLAQVLKEAVDCRNHFVHGSARRFDYDDGALVTFFTDALEFVFVAYDLALAGWSPHWPARGFGGSHPFQAFVSGYDPRLADLRSRRFTAQP